MLHALSRQLIGWLNQLAQPVQPAPQPTWTETGNQICYNDGRAAEPLCWDRTQAPELDPDTYSMSLLRGSSMNNL